MAEFLPKRSDLVYLGSADLISVSQISLLGNHVEALARKVSPDFLPPADAGVSPGVLLPIQVRATVIKASISDAGFLHTPKSSPPPSASLLISPSEVQELTVGHGSGRRLKHGWSKA